MSLCEICTKAQNPLKKASPKSDLIIDLCCGTGRFPGNNVISIDIQKRLKPTICADIRHLPLKPKLHPKLVHASPPCTYFSLERIRKYGYDPAGIAEGLQLVSACFAAFAYLEPHTWTLENPRGLLRVIIPGEYYTEYATKEFKQKPTNFWSNNKALKRALIPMHIRQKILSVTEN